MRRHRPVVSLLAGALAVAVALALPPATGARSAVAAQAARTARTTRADLDAARRRAAVLESELALAATRKPYLVLDLGGRALRYRLMGMTMREVPIHDLAVEGLETSEGTPGAPLLAGIFTLQEKENDPRLKPLSPEQVEDGADDENAANALPPEPPREYRLSFKQPIAVEVLGRETRSGVDGMWGRFVGALRRWHGPAGGDEARLKIALHLDPDVASEIYRSLIPELRLLVLPPDGMTLPAAGQEAPPKPRPAKKPPAPVEKPSEPKDVPFAIPPPEDEQNRKAAEENGETTEPPPAEAPPVPAPEPPPPPPPGGGTQAPGPGRAAAGSRGGTAGSHGSGGGHGLSGRLSRPT
ncbi:MAG TPA: hypothetical protein VFC25_08915 [Verrucomicrobiae bacterium]|nr:hypothetical protein [Verrucomicrobiae bacterium]